MKQAVIKLLRGEYNSVRYRFTVLPRLWLAYAWYRLTGRDWIAFYSTYLDAPAREHKAAKERPSDRYLNQAIEHLEFLKKRGLKPGHWFLDYGCGVLRMGRLVIPYLDGKTYVGVDISRERLEQGAWILSQDGIAEDRYSTFHVSDCSFREVEGHRFDIIWAKSVLTHMEMTDINRMFAAIGTVMGPDSRFYFTFSESAQPKRLNIKDFWYPREDLKKAADAHGFSFEVDPDWDPKHFGDTMACVRPKGA